MVIPWPCVKAWDGLFKNEGDFMKDTIQQIVEMDRRAREITEAAQTERTHSEKEITERCDELRRSYLEKAKHPDRSQ